MKHEFSNRTEALTFLRQECPPNLRHVIDSGDAMSLVELFFEGLTREPLLTTRSAIDESRKPGYGAYIRNYAIVVNVKKAALVSAALLVDVLLTQGVAGLVLTQVMRDPVFIRRLTSTPHLMCMLTHDNWSSLSYSGFRSTLSASLCKHPHFACRFQVPGGACHMLPPDFEPIGG